MRIARQQSKIKKKYSHKKDQQAAVAQLVERIHGKDEVSGSIPDCGSMGGYRSGQTGQTVNLLALCLRRFKSYPAQFKSKDTINKNNKLTKNSFCLEFFGIIEL